MDEIAIPLILARDAAFVQQLQAEPRRLEFIVPEHLHEPRAILRMLQRLELVLDGWRDPLRGVSEKVQQQEALHLEADIGIDDDSQAIENAGPWRIEIPILDGEAVFHDAGCGRGPDLDQLVGRYVADAGADDFVTGKLLQGAG